MMATNDVLSRKRVCLLGLGGGGAHTEVERLFTIMQGDLELVLVYAIASQTTGNWGAAFPVYRAFAVRSPGLIQDSLPRRVVAMARALLAALWIILSCRPDCIVALGTAQAVPFGIAARLLGVPLIFIESLTRIDRHSTTGKIVGRLRLASRHYFQWEALAAQDRRTVFMGSVLG
jgi:hypothetical protein